MTTASVETTTVYLCEETAIFREVFYRVLRDHRGIEVLGVSDRLEGEELAAAAGLRALGGSNVRLRFDANGAFHVDEVEERLDALSAFSPELVEEPTTTDGLSSLASSPVVIALDESVRTDVFPLLLEKTFVKVVVLKPMVLGGVYRGRDLAVTARAFGADAVVSHLFDGPIAHAAALDLARALPWSGLATGLGRHPALSGWREFQGQA